jgi:hypothetical protein
LWNIIFSRVRVEFETKKEDGDGGSCMADRQAEAIKYETEVLKYTSLVTAGIAGGSIGLVLGDLSPFRLVLAVAGFLATVGLSAVMWQFDRRIRSMIAQIQEPL